MEVADTHTYLVGQAGTVVHNTCVIRNGKAIRIEEKDVREGDVKIKEGYLSDDVKSFLLGEEVDPKEKALVRYLNEHPEKLKLLIESKVDIEKFKKVIFDLEREVLESPEWKGEDQEVMKRLFYEVVVPKVAQTAIVGAATVFLPEGAVLAAVVKVGAEILTNLKKAYKVYKKGVKVAKVGGKAYKVYKKVDKLGKAARGVPSLRAAYIKEVKDLSSIASKMRAAGSSSEQIARTLHVMRRGLGVKYKSLTPDKVLQQIYQRNLQKYGDKLGPTINYLRQQGKSWDDIINSATKTGGKDLGF